MERTVVTENIETFDAFCKQLCEYCSIVRYLGFSPKKVDHSHTTSVNQTWQKNGMSRAQMAEQSCPLCRQLFNFAPSTYKIGEVRISLEINVVEKIVTTGQHWELFDGLEILILPHTYEGLPIKFRVAFLDSAFEGIVPIAHFDPCSVDFRWVESWVESCETGHSDQCGIAELLPIPGFRVMDCSTGIVIPMPDISTKYAALSYVWGKPQSDGVAFPRTVQDAMTAAMALGVHYLWVDRYCIDQTDENLKQEQIRVMNIIYAQAYFTIIAPEGDAYQGLPGINGLSRYTPTILSLGNVNMRLIKDPLDDLILGNWIWAKRAWTYQEGCVSRRKIFFTHSGVVFWCGPMYRVESLQCPTLYSNEAKSSYVNEDLRKAVPHVRTTSDDVRENLNEIVNHYSEREMTYEHDALNACLGVLNAFNITHYWGVPILTRGATKSPHLLLCWEIQHSGNERCDFPTWSWTRWNARIRWGSSPWLQLFSSIRAIEMQLQDMEWCDILRGCPYQGNLGIIGYGKKLRITGYTVEFRFSKYDLKEFFVTSSQGIEYQFIIDFDNGDEPTSKGLDEVTMFELEQMNASGIYQWARFLVLRKQGKEYRRIGLAKPWNFSNSGRKFSSRDCTVKGEQQGVPGKIIDLIGRKIQTIHVV